MTINDILSAREPLVKLSSKKFTSFKVVRAIAILVREVNGEYEFFNTQFRELLDLYADKDANGNPILIQNGNIKLKDEEAKRSFDKKYSELLSVDVSDTVHKIDILEADFQNKADYPTPSEMIALETVINWRDDTASQA